MSPQEARRRAVAVGALTLSLALWATACESDDAPVATQPDEPATTSAAPSTPPTTAESTTTSSAAPTTEAQRVSDAGYLDSVRAVTDELESAISALLAARADDGDSADEMFDTYAEFSLSAATENAVTSAAQIDPPAEYAVDHQLWVVHLDEAQSSADRITTAVGNRDQVGVALGVVELEIVAGELALEVTSPRFCEAVRIDADLDRRAICIPPEELGAGEWFATTAIGARRFLGEVLVRAAGIQPSFEEADVVTYLTEVQPDVEAAVAEILADQQAVTPPPERTSDHEELVAYYAAFGELAGRITAAAEAGDVAALPALFEESGAVNERLITSLSDEGFRIISPLFAE